MSKLRRLWKVLGCTFGPRHHEPIRIIEKVELDRVVCDAIGVHVEGRITAHRWECRHCGTRMDRP